ncbi:nucleoside 2-deoxyribosyltransferase [Streptomyces sp. NPDC052179]|uniref:nucleoside 2-deoxyribosyltransferase n=1 Tax=Streptomyces sp. NPDC052179 TaxID=3155680 RepID=UPI003429D3E7
MYYVAHRLFAAHDRLLAARLARVLAAKTGPDQVFLPFCDTDEEDLVAEVKGRRLFELDRERLGKLTAMIAVLHGPSLDDGVCMEMGYAHALGVPIVAVTTDFQTYSFDEDGPRFDFPDPLVQEVITDLVRVPRLGTSPGSTDTANSRYAVFASRNDRQLDQALETAVDHVLAQDVPRPPAPALPAGDATLAFVEQSPYTPVVGMLTALVQQAGWATKESSRFTAHDPLEAARTDLDRSRAAGLLVTDVSGPETPPGAALLIGAAAARGARVIAYYPRTVLTHASGREPNWRNLMIQYAAEARFANPESLVHWLRR